ncbi:MAG: biotin-dependent carboxyltransferase family protein [Candidatus Aquilonibacter sp.]
MSDRAIRVERGGLQSLVVDRGRFGLRHEGVGWCGPMDAHSYATANALVGNVAGAAAIEIVLGDLTVAFECNTYFALTGADCAAELSGEPIRAWRAHEVYAGQRLVLQRPRAWMRSYLAIGGGIDVPLVLGSRTTDLLASMGGCNGRALVYGDRLPIGFATGSPQSAPAQPPEHSFVVRTIAQPLAAHLWNRVWTIGPESNRMGYRMHGVAAPHDLGVLPSYAMFPGFIQLPPSGEPIVLMSDAQTTGGYPLAGVVLEEDLWKLAQAPAMTEIRFVEHMP